MTVQQCGRQLQALYLDHVLSDKHLHLTSKHVHSDAPSCILLEEWEGKVSKVRYRYHLLNS